MHCDAEIALLYTTLPDIGAARTIAATLLDEKLVACCNIIPQIESHYVWQGSPTHTSEVLMLIKTTTERAFAARARVEALHPYAIPAIVAIPVQSASVVFAEWVKENVVNHP